MSRYAVYRDRFGPSATTARRPPTIPPLSEYLEEVLAAIPDDDGTLAGAAGAGPLIVDTKTAIDEHLDLALGGGRL